MRRTQMYGVQQGGGQNRAFFAYIYGWPPIIYGAHPNLKSWRRHWNLVLFLDIHIRQAVVLVLVLSEYCCILCKLLAPTSKNYK